MLKWARERAGMDVDVVAKAERLQANNLAAWERGEGTPSYAMLVRLAKRYNRPLMVFYLPAPPTDFQVANEFRVLAGYTERSESPAVRRTIEDVHERLAWASDFIEENGEAACPVVASLASESSIRNAAAHLRSHLGVRVQDQIACPTSAAAFKLWRTQCEALGVFVFQTGNIAKDGIRGIAFCDKFAPAVVVNTKELFEARVFTMIHELVHIALGQSAVTTFSGRDNRAIERYCDAVAAETLVPTEDLMRRLPEIRGQDFEETATRIAAVYKVSRLAALIKLVEIKAVTWRDLRKKWSVYTAAPTQTTKKQFGPRQPHKSTLNRLGFSFTRLAVSAYDAGEIHGAGLTELLAGMKLKHLPKLLKAVFPNRIQPSTAVN